MQFVLAALSLTQRADYFFVIIAASDVGYADVMNALFTMPGIRKRRPVGAVLLAVSLCVFSLAAKPAGTIPTFEELEKSGAVIGTIRVHTNNIFDDTDPAENSALYLWVNRLHIVTRRDVIERMLLFKPGDKVSVQKINETERVLVYASNYQRRGNPPLGL